MFDKSELSSKKKSFSSKNNNNSSIKIVDKIKVENNYYSSSDAMPVSS